MLPLKLVRSLVLKESLHGSSTSSEDDGDGADSRTPVLVFLPTRELVADTYRLATIARDMGMDLHPTPSLSHIIFTYPPSPSPSPSPTSSSSSASPLSSFPSSSSSLLLPSDAVPLPFPSLSPASISALRSFAALSRGLFKLALVRRFRDVVGDMDGSASFRNWNCCSVSLFSRLSRGRIESMDGFSRALAGHGWTLFKTWKDPSSRSLDSGRARGGSAVYLFRKVDSNRVRVRRDNGECRIRELRLPTLDFRNAPLRILQYIVLMTDDVFYLA